MPTLYQRNPVVVLERVVGNREAIAAQLLDNDGAAVNLTGLAMKFRMVEISTGTVIVNDADATIVDAATGKVSYTPESGDFDAAGLFACYFIDSTTSPPRRWPYDGARWQLNIKSEVTP